MKRKKKLIDFNRFWDLYPIFEKSIDAETITAEHLFYLTNIFYLKILLDLHLTGAIQRWVAQILSHRDSVYYVLKYLFFKCICHFLHLYASKACKILSRSCKDLARNIYNKFKNSAKRQYQF